MREPVSVVVGGALSDGAGLGRNHNLQHGIVVQETRAPGSGAKVDRHDGNSFACFFLILVYGWQSI
jgi:hypothetical protein